MIILLSNKSSYHFKENPFQRLPFPSLNEKIINVTIGAYKKIKISVRYMPEKKDFNFIVKKYSKDK